MYIVNLHWKRDRYFTTHGQVPPPIMFRKINMITLIEDYIYISVLPRIFYKDIGGRGVAGVGELVQIVGH